MTLYLDHTWDHQDLHRAYTVFARSLQPKRPARQIEPLLAALKSYGRNIQACVDTIRLQGNAEDDALVQQSYEAVLAMASDVIGEPYVAYIGAASKPGKSAFCALIRRAGREQQILRVFEGHTLESVTDAGVDFVHALLASKDAAVGVHVVTPTSRQNVLAMPWTEDGHKFFRRVSGEAYKAVYDTGPV